MNDARQHAACEALIPAYALAATDEAERRMVEAHLASCAACHSLLRDYQGLEQELALAVGPVVAAPFGLDEDLHRRIARERAAPAATGPRAAAQPPRTVSRWDFLRRPAFAFGLLALAFLLLTNAYWVNRVGRLEAETDVLAAIVEAPGISLTSETGMEYDHGASRGVLYLPASSARGLLCVYDLPALPADRTYQAWLLRGNQRVSAGIFRVNAAGYGVLLIRAGEPLAAYESLDITVEPLSGSAEPTTPRVMGGAL